MIDLILRVIITLILAGLESLGSTAPDPPPITTAPPDEGPYDTTQTVPITTGDGSAAPGFTPAARRGSVPATGRGNGRPHHRAPCQPVEPAESGNATCGSVIRRSSHFGRPDIQHCPAARHSDRPACLNRNYPRPRHDPRPLSQTGFLQTIDDIPLGDQTSTPGPNHQPLTTTTHHQTTRGKEFVVRWIHQRTCLGMLGIAAAVLAILTVTMNPVTTTSDTIGPVGSGLSLDNSDATTGTHGAPTPATTRPVPTSRRPDPPPATTPTDHHSTGER